MTALDEFVQRICQRHANTLYWMFQFMFTMSGTEERITCYGDTARKSEYWTFSLAAKEARFGLQWNSSNND